MNARINRYGSRNFWLFQLFGWASISFILVYWNMKANNIDYSISLLFSFTFLILGVALSFFYRQYMVHQGWLKLNLTKLFPRIILGSIVFGILFSIIIALVLYVLFETTRNVSQLPFADILGFIINSSLIFMLWSSIYLNYNYYKNYEKEEIKNLKLLASNKEIELQNLKAQLNPHFIFNAMNSIRALIDENPSMAQEAITKLSSILRNSLLSGSGQFVSITHEMEIVDKYLSLEKIRYEERLHYSFHLDVGITQNKIPPLLISTLVENAVKHGISQSKDGGEINISVMSMDDDIIISVTNPGHYEAGLIRDTGIGLANIKKRLQLLYGSRSSFMIDNLNNNVITKIKIPKKVKP